MKKRFEDASARERQQIAKLANKLGVNVVMAPHLCNYDAVFERDGIVSLVEAKCRDFRHDQYPTALLEKKKYDSLIGLVDGNICHKVLYINFYTDGTCLIFNLTNIGDIEWTTDKFVKTTMGDRKKIDKLVAYLPITKATKIDI